MLNEFKVLIDNSQAVLPSLPNDYYETCKYLDIDCTNGYALSWVTDKLKKNIDELLTPTDNTNSISSALFNDLRDGLIYESVLTGCDNSEYLTIIELVDNRSSGLRPLTDVDEWHKAIVYAKDYEFINPGVYTVHHHRIKEKYYKVYEIAKAAYDLKQLGVTVQINDFTLEIPEGLEKIASSIEELIKELGAIGFIGSLFRFIIEKGYFIGPLKRYVIVNPITVIPSQARPLLPFGYLLNLAIKHLDVPPAKLSTEIQEKKYNEALERSRLLTTVVGIRNYGVFDQVFQDTEKLPDFISRLALFDSTYTIISNDPNEVMDYLTHLFDWLNDADFEAKFGFSVNQFKNVCNTILKTAPENGPFLFTLDNVQSWNTEIPKNLVEVILEYLTHDPSTVNKEYRFFNDYLALDYGFKPLILISSGYYILADRSWCAQAFFEAFSACCRDVDSQCDNKIGSAAERYLTHALQSAGITMIQGDYANAKGRKTGEGEADGIIESSRSIITLESKKKPLTRRARGGSDIQLLIDLAGSLLAAHVQSGRTEIKLRENNHIYLLHNNINNRIDLNDRVIDRIAMSVLDYGSFQDRNVIIGLLTNLANAQYKLIDETDVQNAAKFDTLERKRLEWEEQVKKLKVLDPGFNNFPFFNCWFLSLSQLLMIIRYCTNNEDFANALKSTRHATFGVGNFYYEFYHLFIPRQEN